ncbi:hypothetical protein GCM10011371_31880 [Novosphingobium marinum]|nr:hypothetical protein GCM10011371_31880 [Novosphingobium marinum]
MRALGDGGAKGNRLAGLQIGVDQEHAPPDMVHGSETKEKDIMVRKLLTMFGIGVFALTASACNTIDGAGEDIESVGDEIDEEI